MTEEPTNEEVVTEVTTIADEEAKTGEKLLPEMNEEEFVARTSVQHQALLQHTEALIKDMKAKHVREAVIAALDVRQADVPVSWAKKTQSGKVIIKPEYEKIFQLYQVMSSCITQNLILLNYQAKKRMIEEASKAKVSEETTDTTTDSTNEGEN